VDRPVGRRAAGVDAHPMPSVPCPMHPAPCLK
jgi:hypothetical protein